MVLFNWNLVTMSLSLKYKVCPHCSRSLNIKTFKEHKRLFYSEQSSTWIISNDDSDGDSSDISIEPGEMPESVHKAGEISSYEQFSDVSSDMEVISEPPLEAPYSSGSPASPSDAEGMPLILCKLRCIFSSSCNTIYLHFCK